MASRGEEMNWKKFLQPDWKKLLVAVVIFVGLEYFLIYIFSSTTLTFQAVPWKNECCANQTGNLTMSENQNFQRFCSDWTNRTGFIINAENCNNFFAQAARQQQYYMITYYAEIITLFLFSYLFSCFLFWIFTRKKENPE